MGSKLFEISELKKYMFTWFADFIFLNLEALSFSAQIIHEIIFKNYYIYIFCSFTNMCKTLQNGTSRYNVRPLIMTPSELVR